MVVKRGSMSRLYRKQKTVTQDIAIVWRAGESEPGFLMTNLERIRHNKLTAVFGRRMSIEEYFRDEMNKRNGFALRLTMIKSSERLSRFLLILALAYILLVTVGLYVRKHFKPMCWCSNNRVGECSFFTVGRIMLNTALPSLNYLLRGLRIEVFVPKGESEVKLGKK